MKLLVLTCLLLEIQQAFGYWPPGVRPPLMSMGRPFHGFVPSPVTDEESFAAQTRAVRKTFVQLLDHFNKNDKRVWNQTYFVNDLNYKNKEVVFLIVGGEGPESGWLAEFEGTPLMTMAEQFGAIIFDLEHRFYGSSRPFPLQTTLNLRYLTSHQAVEDIAYFIRYINKMYKFKNPKWITFGCSYPGSLSAWVNELHPELITGSYSTSAAVQAEYDFYQYLEVVESAIKAYNTDCANNIGAGIAEMGRLIWTPEGRNKLSDVFQLIPRLNETALSYNDIAYFLFCIHVNFQTSVQYSEDNAATYYKAGSIADLCKIMNNNTMTPMERLAQVNIYMVEIFGYPFTGTYASYDGYVKYIQDVNYYGDGDDAASRGWVWQTCNEFGFLQSTDTGKNIFGSQTPANLFINWCSDIFGPDFKALAVEKRTHDTNAFYGGKDGYRGRNAIFITGGADPWYPLGVYFNRSSVVSYRSPGTAHCADMYVPRKIDKPGLAVARRLVKENVAKWLGIPLEKSSDEEAADPKHEEQQQKQEQPSIFKYPQMKEFSSTIEQLPLEPFKEAIAPRHHKSSFYNGPAFLMGRPRGGFLAEPPMPAISDYPPGFVAGTIQQPVDNFNASSKATYKQRYWYNPQYYKPNGPLFLFICGESPADIKWVTNPDVQIMTAAREYSASVFMLEHRYYGKSWPTPNQSTENLKWLSVEQALADAARFIKAMNKEHGYVNPKWITFGGSYPGSMSAWMRQFHPDLVTGAMASSAPIEVKVDFYGYELQCQNSMQIYNPACSENIGIAFENMHQLSLTGEGRVELSKIFSLVPAWNNTTKVNEKDMQNFFAIMYQNFDSIVQYNNDNRGIYAYGEGMREGCGIMQNNERFPMQNLAEVNKYVATFPNGTFKYTDYVYQHLVDYLKYDKFFDGSDWRTWTYQTCTQFGFFESTDIGYNIWGSPVPVNFWIEMCADIFGPKFTSKRIYKAVDDLQKLTGGRDHYHGTNVMFTNGNIDPWHLQGKYNGTGTVTTILMNGTAHCAEMYPPRPQDAPDLKPVRELALKKIGEWLGVTAASSTTTSTSRVTAASSTTTSTSRVTAASSTTTSTSRTTAASSTTTSTSRTTAALTTTTSTNDTTSSSSRAVHLTPFIFIYLLLLSMIRY